MSTKRRIDTGLPIDFDSKAIADVIKGPEAHKLDHDVYLSKLAGTENLPEITAHDQARAQARARQATDHYKDKPTIIRQSDCCNGTVLEFPDADVCIASKPFTWIDNLKGNEICIDTADRPLPRQLIVTVGEKGNVPGDSTEYFSRRVFPHWMWSLIHEEIADDPTTSDVRKALWKQIESAITKKPRKRKKQ